jgi:hypothetical protein
MKLTHTLSINFSNTSNDISKTTLSTVPIKVGHHQIGKGKKGKVFPSTGLEGP